MRTRRSQNILWGLITVIISVLLLLRGLEIIPDGPFDVIVRSWPVIFVFFGLYALLQNRLPLANFAALVLSVGLVTGVAWTAYSARASRDSDAQQYPINVTVADTVTLLVININTLDTDVTLSQVQQTRREIIGRFTGSEQSVIIPTYDEVEEEGRAEFTLTESKSESFPTLESVGRGRLILEVPPGIGVAVVVSGQDGDISLDTTALSLERLSVTLQHGDAQIMLPAYQPQSPNAAETPGQLFILDGDLTIFAPPTVDIRVMFDRRGSNIDPQFPPSYIEVRDITDGMLRRDDESSDILYQYAVVIPNGLLSLQQLEQD